MLSPEEFAREGWNNLTLNKWWPTISVVLQIAALLLLVAMLAYPFGYDQSTFSVAGERVARMGAIPYRDFIDTKPPIIFYLYALNYLIFGHHFWSIRAFDLVYMLFTAWYFRQLIIRWTSSAPLATIAQFLFVLHYAASGYWMTAQCESFAFLPTLLLIDLTMRARSGGDTRKLIRMGIAIGLLAQFLFLLKFTLIAAPIAAGLWMLFLFEKRRIRELLIVLGSASAAFLLSGTAYVMWMIGNGGDDRMVEALRWLQGYAAIEPHWSTNALSHYYQSFPANYILAFSFTLAALGLYGMVSSVFSAREIASDRRNHFLKLFILVQLLSLVAVIYEKKFFLYHYGRVFPSEAILEAVAILLLAPLFARCWNRIGSIPIRVARWTAYAFACIAIVTVLFFSSFSGVASQSVTWLNSAITGQDASQRVQSLVERYYPEDQKHVAEFLKPRMLPNDQVFLWGNDQGLFFTLDRLPRTICLTNTPFATTWTPASWKNKLLSQLTTDPPRYIILEWGDTRDYITDAEGDSYHLITRLPQVVELINTAYRPLATVGHFMIYEKR